MSIVFGTPQWKLDEILHDMGVEGVVMPGALSFDTYPQKGSAAVSIANNATATLIAANAVASTYRVTHATGRTNTGSGAVNSEVVAVQLRTPIADVTPRRQLNLDTWYATDTGSSQFRSMAGSGRFAPPLRVPANVGMDVFNAGSGVTIWPALTILKRPPLWYPPAAMTAPGHNTVDALASISVNTGGTPNVYSAYSQLLVTTTSYVLLTRLYGQISSYTSAIPFTHLGFATAPSSTTINTGSEVDFGIFGSNYPNHIQMPVYWDLGPYPVLIPPNTRVAVRGSSQDASSATTAGIYYVTLPLRPS